MECDGLAMCSTVAFRRLPVMANCVGVLGCVRVCVCVYIYTVYKVGGREREG